jgi:hypothetical protein
MKVRINLSVFIVALVVALYGTVASGEEQKTEVVQAEAQKMLFLCYWQLNENIPVIDHLKVGKLLKEAGLFPPPGIEIIRFDMTPDYWGITVFTAESAEAAFAVIDLWRVAGTGFFSKVKVSPALPVKDASALGAKLYQTVKEAEAKMAEKETTSHSK